MLTLEQLIALHNTFTGAHPRQRATAPTESGILHINNALGIILPSAFVDFARRCPSYACVLFASIGEDFDDDHHIVNINRAYHSDLPPCVPPWLIVFNHGHDEDCEGFDLRQRSGDEYPIVYWDASKGLDFDNSAWRASHNFHDYLEFMITHYANATDKKRAEQIIRTT